MQNAECARMFAFSAQAAGAVSKQPFRFSFPARKEKARPLFRTICPAALTKSAGAVYNVF